MNWSDIALRAFKTAVQTFVATVSVAALTSFDVNAVKAGAVAAAAAGISVIWNAIAQWSATS